MSHAFDVSLDITSVQHAYMVLLADKLKLNDEDFVKKALVEYIAEKAAIEFKDESLRKKILEDKEE